MTHVITINMGEAVGNVRETVRAQLATLTFGGFPLLLAVADPSIPLHNSPPLRDLSDEERERLIENIATNVAQGLYALEVVRPPDALEVLLDRVRTLSNEYLAQDGVNAGRIDDVAEAMIRYDTGLETLSVFGGGSKQ